MEDRRLECRTVHDERRDTASRRGHASHRGARELALSWADFEAAAPRLAREGRALFERAGVALLGTIRKDGSPRISPIEPFFAGPRLLVGAMAWSAKAHDLARDPRLVLHSVVTAPNAGETEFKVYGRAQIAEDAVRDAVDGAWWVAEPHERAAVYSLEVGGAALVAWDLAGGEVTIERWSPERGLRAVRRRYP